MSADAAAEVDGRRWLSVAEVAAELGMCQMTLYRVIKAGQFPAVRVGRRLVIPAAALDAMAAAAVASGAPVSAGDWSRGGVA